MEKIIHNYDFKVLYQHLDIFGHVNNASYLNIFEEARWDLIEKNGYGLNKILETQKGPTILDIQIRFKQELKFRDKANIKTFAPKKSGKLMTLEQHLFGPNEQLCCTAVFKFAFFDMKLRKIIEPSTDWLQAIDP